MADHSDVIEKSLSTAAAEDDDDAAVNVSSAAQSDAPSIHEDYTNYERDKYLAFIPQVTKWGCGILSNEVTTAANAVVAAPTFTKNFLSGTYAYYRANPRTLYKEIVSGFTVAIMQVPESIAFSFVAGVPPLSGLQATWWMAFITGILGGKPGMISGAAGALAVVVTRLTASDGVLSYLTVEERLNVLYMTMFVCGIFQIGFAVFRLAKLVRLIPETGMIGFMNGKCVCFRCCLVSFLFGSTIYLVGTSLLWCLWFMLWCVFICNLSLNIPYVLISSSTPLLIRSCHHYFHGTITSISILYRGTAIRAMHRRATPVVDIYRATA